MERKRAHMIDTVIFENQHGEKFMPYEQYGIYMKSHSISPPKPKLYRYAVEGADGEIDLSEWSGEVRFEPREVSISFREMGEKYYHALVQFALGRMIKVMFSNDRDYYCYGRCTAIDADTKKRVSDVDMTVVCDAYRLARVPTIVTVNVPGSGSVVLKARRMTATPTITASAGCSVTFGGTTYSLSAGAQTVDGIRITDRPQTMTISGTSNLEIRWTDGVL